MRILFLSTWLPYPPNQGSKIRAYHLLRALAEAHPTALLSFQDAPVQPEWLEHLGRLCARVEVVPRRPFDRSRLKTWLGWFSPRPSAIVGGHSPEMAASVRRTVVDWRPDAVVALTFVTAPYAQAAQVQTRVVDVDNLLALMLREEAQAARGIPQRIRRSLAYRKFRAYERQLYPRFDQCLVTSALDRERIAAYIPLLPQQIGLVPNGVDLAHYRPDFRQDGRQGLVFSGALTYGPNRDAMEHFLSRIYPAIQASAPETGLTITGSTAGVRLKSLRSNGHVRFTGHVDDIRPVVAGAAVCVVPLRQGAGTRLKILEAMALGTPVVSTSKGAEGLEVRSEEHLLIADDADQFAEHTLRLLRSPQLRARLAAKAYDMMREKYDWAKIRAGFRQLVEQVHGRAAHG